jgi:hypothetical protein
MYIPSDMSIQVPKLTDFDPFPGDLFAHRELFDTIDADGSGVIKKSVPSRRRRREIHGKITGNR